MSPKETAASDYQAVLAEIRAEMARKQISGLELAHMTGLAQSTISRRLNGAPFSLQEVLAICSALGISLRTVLDDAAKRRPAPVPQMRDEGQGLVAGVRFELTTSGLCAPDDHTAPVIPLRRPVQTGSVGSGILEPLPLCRADFGLAA